MLPTPFSFIFSCFSSIPWTHLFGLIKSPAWDKYFAQLLLELLFALICENSLRLSPDMNSFAAWAERLGVIDRNIHPWHDSSRLWWWCGSTAMDDGDDNLLAPLISEKIMTIYYWLWVLVKADISNTHTKADNTRTGRPWIMVIGNEMDVNWLNENNSRTYKMKMVRQKQRGHTDLIKFTHDWDPNWDLLP